MPNLTEENRKKDSLYLKYQGEGYSFWNSYSVKPEMDRAVNNLHHWGSKVKIIKYPNGTYVVMQKGGKE